MLCSTLNLGRDTSTDRDRHSLDDTTSCRMFVLSLLVSRLMPRCLLNGGKMTNRLMSPPLYGNSSTCAPNSSELTAEQHVYCYASRFTQWLRRECFVYLRKLNIPDCHIIGTYAFSVGDV